MIPSQIGLLAESFFDLLGPILIFGIYIIASIAKTVAQKGQKDDSDEEPESESGMKKAILRRYQEIHQRQVGNTAQNPLEPQRPRVVQPRTVQQSPSIKQPQHSQWEIQQEAIRQHNAKLQSQRTIPKRPHIYIQKQAPAAVNQPKPAQMADSAPVQAQKKLIQQQVKTIEGSQRRMRNLLSMLRRPENLRSSIILKEILDKPRALRDV
jgi:hypothetical protein